VTVATVIDASGETARLRALEDLGISATRREERFDRITRLAQRLFCVERVAVTLVDRETQWFKSDQGFDGLRSVPSAGTFCTTTLARPGITVSEDTRRDDRFAGNPYVVGEPHIRFYAGHPLRAASGHAVGTLCLFDGRPRRFTDTEQELLRELGEWVETELNRSAEMEQAAAVQRALLPRNGALAVPGYEIAGTCLPARAVGGDVLDWFRAADEDVVVALGDVMGKGIAAALIATSVRSAVRTAARTHPPAVAIGEAARTLDDDLQETSTLVTLCLCRLTPTTGRLRWADAGHGLMALIRADGTVRRASRGGLPLGTLPDGEWCERELVLEAGDMVIAFSDGLLDRFDTVDAAFDAVVRGVRSDPATAVQRLERSTRTAPLTDDVAGVLIRRLP
jgi:Stage II sporulation protein E (SpoIIE)/GAF domain